MSTLEEVTRERDALLAFAIDEAAMIRRLYAKLPPAALSDQDLRDLRALRARKDALLPADSQPPAPAIEVVHCRECDAPIVFALSEKGRPTPYDVVDGKATRTSHFTTCTNPKRFSKKRRQGGRG